MMLYSCTHMATVGVILPNFEQHRYLLRPRMIPFNGEAIKCIVTARYLNVKDSMFSRRRSTGFKAPERAVNSVYTFTRRVTFHKVDASSCIYAVMAV